MKKKTWIYAGIGLVVLFIVLIVIVNSKEKSLYVSIEKSARRNIIETVTANGTIQPEVEVKLSSEVSGEIIEVFVREGDSVRKGDLLIQVNPDISESNVARATATVNNAKANLAAAEARVAQAKARLLQVENNYNRNKKLFADKVIPASEFEASEAEFISAQSEYNAAKRAVDAAFYTVKSVESTLKGEQKTLRRTSIFAPMDGIVSKLNVEKGERVVGTMQMTGTELLRVADFSRMELRVDVGESDIIRVSVGDTAEISVDAYSGRTILGVVKEVANSAKSTGAAVSTDQVTNFEVKITLLHSSYADLLEKYPGKASPFLPGMSGMADIRTRSANSVVSVPIEAVTLRNDTAKKEGEEKEKLEVVFSIQDGKSVMIPVKTGVQDSKFIEITEGLEPEVDVITGPYSLVSKTLEAGKKVEVKKKEELLKKEKK